MKCANKEIGKYLNKYIRNKLSGELRGEFEVHLFECTYCWGKVQQAEKDEELDTLIRTYGRKAFIELRKKIEQKASKESFVSNIWDLIEKIRSLKSAFSFPLELVPLGATRGPEPQKRVFAIGETVLLSLEAPRDGHIAVFHYDSEGNLRLVFPQKKDDVTFAKSKEEKRIGMKVTEPAARHWLKAVFFGKEVIIPDKIRLEDDDTSGLTAIEAFLDAIPNLKEDEWMEAEYEFEVVGS